MTDLPHEPDAHQPEPQSFPEVEGYDVIDLVASGGMGAVYEAIQQATGRRVALKVMLDSAMASGSAAQRFDREVEFIARLDHPNIVAVLDSGVVDGRRYCVMDYVDGQLLDDAFTPGETDPRAALAIIEKVARAVDYAHQRGVLHRDLKPSNIMIDDRGEPRLLDFGLAKAIDPVSAMGGRRTISEQGQLIGTVAYMSPEQARGDLDKLSVRTDVYALGAIAYELLTGFLPVDVSGSLGETLHRLEQRDSKRPSALRKGLSADTDAIIGKALEKDPEKRYETASALADDIRRSLDGFPIRARRISPAARFGRWAKRNPKISGVTGVSLVVLVVGGSVALWRILDEQASTLDRQQRMSGGIFQLDPNRLGNDITLRKLLEMEVAKLDGDPIDDPKFECEYRQQLGHRFLSVREWDQAIAQLQIAQRLQERTGVGGRTFRATILHDLGAAHWWKQEFAEAEPYYREALRLRESALGPDHADTAETMDHLASTLDRLGKPDEAEPMHRKALDIRRKALGEDHEQTIASVMSLSNFLMKNGRYAEAEPLLRDATARIRQLKGERFEGVAIGLAQLGICLIELGQWAEAQSVLEQSLRIKDELWGEENDSYAWTLHQLARIAQHNRDDRALRMAQQAASTLNRTLGADSEKTRKANALVEELRASAGRPG